MICTISSRTSPRPPGNWCEARSVVAPNAVVPNAAQSALATSSCLMRVINLLLVKFAAYPKLYHLRCAQPGDVGLALAQQPAQHLFGVRTEQRRREPVFDRRVGKAHGARHERQLCAGAVLELDAHTARLHLRLLENLGDVVDRPVRYARGLEELEPFALRALAEDRGEQAGKLGAVLDALGVRGE